MKKLVVGIALVCACVFGYLAGLQYGRIEREAPRLELSNTDDPEPMHVREAPDWLENLKFASGRWVSTDEEVNVSVLIDFRVVSFTSSTWRELDGHKVLVGPRMDFIVGENYYRLIYDRPEQGRRGVLELLRETPMGSDEFVSVTLAKEK